MKSTREESKRRQIEKSREAEDMLGIGKTLQRDNTREQQHLESREEKKREEKRKAMRNLVLDYYTMSTDVFLEAAITLFNVF